MDQILGVCPTCYLVVTEKQEHVKWIGQETVYYHRDCEPMRLKFLAKNAHRWREEGKLFKEMREKNGFTVAELAEFLGVSETKIRRFESGKPIIHARLLAMAYTMFFKLYGIYLNETAEKEAAT